MCEGGVCEGSVCEGGVCVREEVCVFVSVYVLISVCGLRCFSPLAFAWRWLSQLIISM